MKWLVSKVWDSPAFPWKWKIYPYNTPIGLCLPPSPQTAIVKEEDVYVNRVECDTAFDFDRVEQILISEPISCPVKQGYSYVRHCNCYGNTESFVGPRHFDM